MPWLMVPKAEPILTAPEMENDSLRVRVMNYDELKPLLHLSNDTTYVVNFWATWCPICRAEQGSIESLAKDNPNVITVAMQSGNAATVQQYMREQDISFPALNDADNRISASWGVQAVPASFIVDTDGKIRYVEIGYTTGVGLRLRLWLAEF